MAQTSALIAPVQPILHRVSYSNETLPNIPKFYETDQNMSLGSNGVDQVRSLRKIPMRLRGKNFCINFAPVQPVLHQASGSNEILPNTPKHYETYQNMSFGFDEVDWVRSLQKITMWRRGTNFCINCTSALRFAPSFMQLRNDPKCTQTLCNAPKHVFRANGVDWVRSLRKIPTWYRGTKFCINCTRPCFASSFMQLRNDPKCIPNTMQHTKTWV